MYIYFHVPADFILEEEIMILWALERSYKQIGTTALFISKMEVMNLHIKKILSILSNLKIKHNVLSLPRGNLAEDRGINDVLSNASEAVEDGVGSGGHPSVPSALEITTSSAATNFIYFLSLVLSCVLASFSNDALLLLLLLLLLCLMSMTLLID